MATDLSHEQILELSREGGRPIHVVDPGTRKMYVIVPAELYDKVRILLDDDAFDIRDTYLAQESAFAKIWSDPELDEYNDYDAMLQINACLKASLDLP